MKKMLIGLVLVGMLAMAGASMAQSFDTITMICTTGDVALSRQITVSGYIDKIEYIKTGANTNTFTVGTFSDTTAIDTFATKAIGGAVSGVIRPRTVGTTTAGSALVGAVTTASVTTNALGQVLTSPATTTTLAAPYERFRASGNMVIKLDGTGDDQSGTNVFRIYSTPN